MIKRQNNRERKRNVGRNKVEKEREKGGGNKFIIFLDLLLKTVSPRGVFR